MKHILIFYCAILTVLAQAQEPSFEQVVTGTPFSEFSHGLETSAGTILLADNYGIDFDGQRLRMLRLMEFRADGELARTLDLGDFGDGIYLSSLLELDDYYVCLGRLDSGADGSTFLWWQTVSKDLQPLEEKRISLDMPAIRLFKAKPLQDGRLFLTGANFDWSAFAVLLSPEGEILAKRLGYQPGFPADFTERADGNLILHDIGTLHLFSLESFSVTSTIMPSTPYVHQQNGNMLKRQDGGFYICGKRPHIYSSSGSRDIAISIYNEDIEVVADFEFGSPEASVTDFPADFQCLSLHDPNRVYCGGTSNVDVNNLAPVYSINRSSFVLLQTDSLLNVNWERYYGGDAYYMMQGIIATSDGGCVMHGRRYDYNSDLRVDAYVLKVDAQGEVVSSTAVPLPQGGLRIFPNPASGFVQVGLPEGAPEGMPGTLYSMDGRPARQFVHRAQEPLSLEGLPAGGYVLSLRDGRSGRQYVGRVVKR